MIVIGEKLNSSIPSAFEMFKNRDENAVVSMAEKQLQAGADYLDINTGVLENEKETMLWCVQTILRALPAAKLALDSTDPSALAWVLEQVPLKDFLINSINLEPTRYQGVLALLKKYPGAGVIALPIDDVGIPKDTEGRLTKAKKLIDSLKEEGISLDRVYVDILAEALSVEYASGRFALETAASLRKAYPEIHLVAGLSNISFGLPKRMILNNAFLSAAITMGLDAAIMDITNDTTRMTMRAALLINGQDEYCMEYLTDFREIYDN